MDVTFQATPARPQQEPTVAQLQAKSHMVNQQSVKSTRRMVTLVAECEDTGAKTLAELDQQGEQLDTIETTMEKVDANIKEADDALAGRTKTGKRSKKDRLLRILCCTGERKSKRATGSSGLGENNTQSKAQKQGDDESSEEMELQVTAYSLADEESHQPDQNRRELNRDKPQRKLKGMFADYLPWIGRNNKKTGSEGKPVAAGTGESRYVKNIMGTKEEDEMNQNLEVVDRSVQNLHKMATTMEQELDEQNEQLERMNTRQKEINAGLTETRGKIDERLGDKKKKPLISGKVVLKQLLD